MLLVGGEGPASATGVATYPLSGLLFDPDTNEFNEIALSGLSQGRAYFALVPVAEETSSVIEPTETDGDTSITTDGDTTVDGDTADGDVVTDGDTATGGSVFSNMQQADTTTKRFFIIGGKTAAGPIGEVLYGTYQSIGDEAAVALQPISGSITPVFQLATATLPDGRILITGGYSAEGRPVTDAYLLDPFNAAGPTLQQVGAMKVARYRHTATTLPSGHVVIVGGMTADGSTISDVEVFDPDTLKFNSYEVPEDETSDPLLTSRAGHIAVPLIRYNADGTIDAAGSRVAVYGGYRVLEDVKTYFNKENAAREVDVPLIDFQGKVYPYTPTFSSGYFAAQKLETLNQGRASTQVNVTSYHLSVDSEWVWLGDSPSTIIGIWRSRRLRQHPGYRHGLFLQRLAGSADLRAG